MPWLRRSDSIFWSSCCSSIPASFARPVASSTVKRNCSSAAASSDSSEASLAASAVAIASISTSIVGTNASARDDLIGSGNSENASLIGEYCDNNPQSWIAPVRDSVKLYSSPDSAPSRTFTVGLKASGGSPVMETARVMSGHDLGVSLTSASRWRCRKRNCADDIECDRARLSHRQSMLKRFWISGGGQGAGPGAFTEARLAAGEWIRPTRQAIAARRSLAHRARDENLGWTLRIVRSAALEEHLRRAFLLGLGVEAFAGLKSLPAAERNRRRRAIRGAVLRRGAALARRDRARTWQRDNRTGRLLGGLTRPAAELIGLFLRALHVGLELARTLLEPAAEHVDEARLEGRIR